MRLSAIVLTSILAACAEGVFEDPPDASGPDGRTGTGGAGGKGASGGTGGTGGVSTGGSGGSGATGGSGGSSATGGRGGSGGSGGSAGSAGRGGSSGSGGSAGRSGSGGSGGADGGAGCIGTPDWMTGGTYAMGDRVRAVCSTASSGSGATCTVGKTYAWSCSIALACGFVGPGTMNWGLAWALGSECN